MMDVQPLVPWLSVIAMLISIGTAVTTFFTSGAKQNASKLIEHDRRIQAVESEIKHMPDIDIVHRLQLDMTEMKGQIASMVKTSEATERTARRVEDFLMNRAN